jgi:multidrug efflux pump
MSLSSPFIHRPVATALLTAAIALAGAVAFTTLPVSPLPQIDFPTINVQAQLPGGSPEIMASSVATPLERQFGRIANITEMTSSSYLGTSTGRRGTSRPPSTPPEATCRPICRATRPIARSTRPTHRS